MARCSQICLRVDDDYERLEDHWMRMPDYHQAGVIKCVMGFLNSEGALVKEAAAMEYFFVHDHTQLQNPPEIREPSTPPPHTAMRFQLLQIGRAHV